MFEKPIRVFADAGDILVAISSSGQSPNILLGVNTAKEIGCKVITLSGFSNENSLKKLATHKTILILFLKHRGVARPKETIGKTRKGIS